VVPGLPLFRQRLFDIAADDVVGVYQGLGLSRMVGNACQSAQFAEVNMFPIERHTVGRPKCRADGHSCDHASIARAVVGVGLVCYRSSARQAGQARFAGHQ
jgi:hypothetical protein